MNKSELNQTFNLRIDRASRLYTVLNIPADIFEEPYNLRTGDINTIAKNYISDYTSAVSTFLNSKGLLELYSFYQIDKVEKYSYLIVFGFRLFNTQKFFKTILLYLLPIFIIALIILFLIIHFN